VVLVLLFTGIVLSSVYKRSVERAFDRRLTSIWHLIAEAAAPWTKRRQGRQAASARALARRAAVRAAAVGWYWRMARTDGNKTEMRARARCGTQPADSRSRARARPVRRPLAESPARDQNCAGGAAGRSRHRGQVPRGGGGDATEIDEETRAFNIYLAVTFAALTVGLLLTTIFQVRFGLKPLKRISNSLAAIRSGHAERLEGDFPREIAPLARETNALLDANRAIVERARTHVGNLAHAIKTPLSVLVNEASAKRGDLLADKVLEQAEIMRSQVAHHLERARIAARVQTIGTVTEVAPVVAALCRTMEKIHRDRDVAIDIEVQDGARFRGERQDLEEMTGNLIDNACKWARQRVFVEVLVEPAAGTAAEPVLRIVVDDDGPGLSPDERRQVARRGRRLDETKPGSGLGLSIVTDLAALYGGSLTLGAAPIGGLRAELALPGV